MNALNLGILTCLALVPVAPSMNATSDLSARDEEAVAVRANAFPISEKVESLLPDAVKPSASAVERALTRAVSFRRDRVDVAPFRAVPRLPRSLEGLPARSRLDPVREGRPGTRDAALDGAPVAPSFAPESHPIPPER